MYKYLFRDTYTHSVGMLDKYLNPLTQGGVGG